MESQWYRQSPVAAVIYHQFGSLAVLLNAMRLLWFEERGQIQLLGGPRNRRNRGNRGTGNRLLHVN